jgi:hypothetical protein
MREAKAGEDLGSARGRRMGADVGKTSLDLGDSMRIGRRLGSAGRCARIGTGDLDLWDRPALPRKPR